MSSLHRITAVSFISASLIIPSFTHADLASDLQLQVAQLLAEISAFQAQLNDSDVSLDLSNVQAAHVSSQTVQAQYQAPVASLTAPFICPSMLRTLKNGSVGEDVADLQTFLARDRSVYPEGHVTAFFGALTEAAVQRWQAKYGIVSSGNAQTTGWGVVGPATRRVMSDVCRNTAPMTMAQTIPVTTGGTCPVLTKSFPQCLGTWKEIKDANGCTTDWQCEGSPVSTEKQFAGQLLATSTWGVPPLTTTFWTWVLPNAVGTYRLDFGDGFSQSNTPCPTYAYGCLAPTETKHTYQIPGKFTARLIKDDGKGVTFLGEVNVTVLATSTFGSGI